MSSNPPLTREEQIQQKMREIEELQRQDEIERAERLNNMVLPDPTNPFPTSPTSFDNLDESAKTVVTNPPTTTSDQPNTTVYVLPTTGDNILYQDDGEMVDDVLETTSIGRVEREDWSGSDNDHNDHFLSDTSSISSLSSDISSDSDDSDSDPLNLFSNKDMLSLVAEMLDRAEKTAEMESEMMMDLDADGLMGTSAFRTENEISEEFIAIAYVESLQQPDEEYIKQLDKDQPWINGLEPLGTIMNLFEHKVILKPFGTKNPIFTDSSDSDDSSDDDYFGFQSGGAGGRLQRPNAKATGKIASTDALARLTTLKLQTPIFNKKGEAVGRLSDTIGHVQFPFFVVSFHNEVSVEKEQEPEQEQREEKKDDGVVQGATDTITATATTSTTESSTPMADSNEAKPTVTKGNNKKGGKGNKNGQNGQNNAKKQPKRSVSYHPVPKLDYSETLYYLPSLTHSVATQTLVGKATDASNRYDEEVDASEMEYSDDEDERNAKKTKKQQKKGQNVQNMNQNDNRKGGQKPAPSQQNANTRTKQVNMMTYNKNQPLDLSSPAPTGLTGATTSQTTQNGGPNVNFHKVEKSQPPRQNKQLQQQQYQPPPPPPFQQQQVQQGNQAFFPPPPPPIMMGSQPQSQQPQSQSQHYIPPTPYQSQQPPNPYNNQQQQQQHANNNTNTTSMGQSNDPQGYNHMVMFQQYQLLASSGIPLTQQQSQHYQQLAAMFGHNVQQ